MTHKRNPSAQYFKRIGGRKASYVGILTKMKDQVPEIEKEVDKILSGAESRKMERKHLISHFTHCMECSITDHGISMDGTFSLIADYIIQHYKKK